ncbi:hypothetical protein MA16_Dca011889 [Dendrobium catenatum]|uniref:Uncharacterized protein n=1 Tax=Dendrobium catenatum TaxID=906689 RepID=A0A2I0W2I9_9ASPA|nr:hypothetical protein MA16_Dca011889 [Dendrobium catenatum]
MCKNADLVSEKLKQSLVDADKYIWKEAVSIHTGKSSQPKSSETDAMQETLDVVASEVTKTISMSSNMSSIAFKNKFNILDGLVEQGEIVSTKDNVVTGKLEDLCEVNNVAYINPKVNMEERKVVEMKEGDSSNLKMKGSKKLKGLGPINLARRCRRNEGDDKDKVRRGKFQQAIKVLCLLQEEAKGGRFSTLPGVAKRGVCKGFSA